MKNAIVALGLIGYLDRCSPPTSGRRQLAVLLVLLALATSAIGDTFKTDANQVYSTLSAAEAAMRSESPALAALVFKRSEWSSPTELTRIYGIDPVPPLGPNFIFSQDADSLPTVYSTHDVVCPTEVPLAYSYQGVELAQQFNLSDVGYPGWYWPCANADNHNFLLGRVLERWACPSGFIQMQVGYPPTCVNGNERTIRVSSTCAINCGPPCPKCGNPVSIAVPNKFQVEVDYRSRSGLRFFRTYNSLLPALQGRSAVGIGWKHNFDRSITTSTIWTASAWVDRSDGRSIQFDQTSGGYVAIGIFASERLERLTDSLGATTGWKVTTADDDVELYSAVGKLQSITNRAGVTQTLSYDGSGRLITVEDSFGVAIHFSYDSSDRIETVTDPAGNDYGYSYTGDNLTEVEYPDGKTRGYRYNEASYSTAAQFPNLLTGFIDESVSRYATFSYDSLGRPTNTQHAAGVESYTLTYSSNPLEKAVLDPLGQSRTYQFQDIAGALRNTSISVPCPGCYASMSYDSGGNVTARVDFNGNVTTYTNDLSRNIEAAHTEAYGTARARTIATQWHSTFRLPTQIDEPGRRTTFTHDSNGNVLTRTILDTTTSTSRTWTYTYNSYGQVLTANGPRTDVSDVTAYTYYSCSTGYQCGQIHTITNAAGHITTYNTYNAHGQPLTITDPNGTVTTLTYDLRQRLLTRTVGTELTSFTYWPIGLLKKATLPDGSYLEYTYDAAHRLTGINDQEGNRIEYTRDAMGNRTAEESFDPSNALSRTRTQVFDTLNRLSQQLGAAATAAVTTTFGYDDNGNQTSIDAPLSRSTAQTYDELNRLTTVTDPESGLTQYGYNPLDQLISVTDPRSLSTTYTYNALGDLTQQISPDTGTTTNTFDSGGNLKTSTDARSAVTTYAYDELNRVTSAAFKIGATTDQTITYGYDSGTNGTSHLTSASDADHSLSWSYDVQGRVIGKTQVQGGVSQSVNYGYTDSLLTSLNTPSGQAITYAYIDGKVSSISINGTTLLSSVLYDPFGPIRQWTWGNSTLSVRSYDEDGKITQLDSAGLNTYSYDDAFRITGITDTANSALSWTYDYDALDRLIDASKPSQTLGWTYDAVGNRLTQTGSGASTFTIDSGSNQLDSVSGGLSRTYSYDAAGNTTSDGANSFAYNNRGRMKSATNGSTTTYTYNALGQRIKKAGSATTLFVYDEAGHLLGEYTSTGALIQETIWLGDTPVATIRPKTGGVDVFYVHTDHLNTPRKVSRPSDNKLRWRWDSTPFGTGAPDENPESLGTFGYNLRFPGQYYDAETGLNYNYFRDYDPATGGYIESDPAGLKYSLNTYAYLDGNPLSGTDPLGLGRAANPHPRPSRVGIFGCLFGACLNTRIDRPEDPQVSFEPSLGGGLEICEDPLPKKEPDCGEKKPKRDCGYYDPNCDDHIEPPGIPVPHGIGFLVGASVKRDGRVCIKFGLFADAPFPFPSVEVGGIHEKR